MMTQHYVIGEDKTPKDVRILLEKSLDGNLDSIALKEGFTLKFQSLKWILWNTSKLLKFPSFAMAIISNTHSMIHAHVILRLRQHGQLRSYVKILLLVLV